MGQFFSSRIQQTFNRNSNGGEGGVALPSVSVLQKKDIAQRQEAEEPLQKKVAQLQGPGLEEEPLQMKAFQLKGPGEEEEPLQMKTFQLKAGPEDEEPLQMKTTQLQGLADEEPLQLKANNTGLPDNLKQGVENLSGHDMSDVKVHYNSSKPVQLNALAYAQGTDIHVGPGQEQHLPHEAWHVAQQKQGRVQPTMQMKAGVAINDDKGLETEADVMGAKAMQHKAIGGADKKKSLHN